MIKMTEHQSQSALIKWCSLNETRLSGLELIHAIANEGSGSKARGARMKREGVKAGVPDLFLPVARGGFFGLYIENKVKGGRVRPNQKKWIVDLTDQGYSVMVSFDWERATQIIELYFSKPPTPQWSDHSPDRKMWIENPD